MALGFADIGTNMAKLLVGDWVHGELHILHERERYIRLGEGMSRAGTISPAALERMRLALFEFKQAAQEHGAGQLFASGTSALRDAENQSEAVDIALYRAGVPLEILSGKAEARLTFLGACSAYEHLEAPACVIDIGGGSTEIAIGQPDSGEVSLVKSLPLGSVRLTEDIAGTNPMGSEHVAVVRDHIEKTLADSQIPTSIQTLVAGTATANVLAELNGSPARLTLSDVCAWAERLLRLNSDEILALHPEALKGRADVFPAGILILQALLKYFTADVCLVSSRRMIHGLAIHHFQK